MKKNLILPGQTIGILGGGQLGRMMAISAKQMGFQIACLDPTPDSPCGQLADTEIVASYESPEAARKLLDASDVITYEFENVDLTTARFLEKNDCLPQGSKLLEITRDRGREKGTLSSFNIPVAPYVLIEKKEDLIPAVDQIGLPAVLKTAQGGYDGKGQTVLRNVEDVQKALADMPDVTHILESWVSFDKEISVIVTRSIRGEMTTFPVGENIHVDNILHQTIVPARISGEIAENAVELAKKIALALDMVGTLAVEMFLTPDGTIYVNELAPRPHNSGHYTIEACETSQFEQHVRAITGLPLGSTALLKPAVMVNILGEHIPATMEAIEQYPDLHLHLYGKKEAKVKRKMGHVTFLADAVEEAIEKAQSLPIWDQVTQA